MRDLWIEAWSGGLIVPSRLSLTGGLSYDLNAQLIIRSIHEKINTIFVGSAIAISLSLLSSVVIADSPDKEYWELHKEQMKNEQERLKRDMELQREGLKRQMEMEREEQINFQEMERERLKHEKEMHQ